MKTCNRCLETLPLASFGLFKTNKDGLHSSCKGCVNTRAKENHLKRLEKEGYREKYQSRLRNTSQERKRWVVEKVYGGYCYDCAESFPACVFDFHHEREKDGNPSAFIGRNTLSKALTELDKCVMLCANCHRMRHFHNKDTDDSPHR